MPEREWSRRDVLRQCLAAGVVVTPAGWSEVEALYAWFDAQGDRQPTAHVEMGPFYKKRAPETASLRKPRDPGMPLKVTGRVINVRGEPVSGAMVEVWQANDAGLYDLDGYEYRATLRPPASGEYGFESVIPGHYPARVARHVHYFATAQGHKPLTTQLYFATDEVFEGNPDKNYSKDPLITSRTLVRPVTLSGNPEAAIASVEFELVLEKDRG
jgi:protocatechuate 3,4-dioxygenase beta subunit